MDYRKDFFYKTFTPCDERRLAEIEKMLGRELPAGYRELLRQTGGGILSEDRDNVPISALGEGFSELVEVVLGNIDGIYDISDSPDFMGPESWSAPEGLLIFAFSGRGPGASFGINYDIPEFPSMSIIYVVVEAGNEMTKVADSFDEFMGMLTKYEHYE